MELTVFLLLLYKVRYAIPAIPIIIAAAATAYKIGKGISQKNKGDALGRTPRPIKATPYGILENNRLARNEAGKYGLPGQGIVEDKMDADVSNAVNSLLISQNNPNSIADTVAKMNYNEMSAKSDLGVKAAYYRADQLAKYMQTNQVVAGYDDKNWDWNKRQPYLDAMAASSALKNAGERNIDSGISDMAKLGISAFGGAGAAVGRSAAPVESAQRIEPTQVNNNTALPDTLSIPEDRKTDAMKMNDEMRGIDKVEEDRMYEKALRMNPNLTRDQFRRIWMRH